MYSPPISSRSTVGSSRYSMTILISDPIEGALARKVDEMGHQLEALKVKYDHPYEKDFNTSELYSLRQEPSTLSVTVSHPLAPRAINQESSEVSELGLKISLPSRTMTSNMCNPSR